MIQRIKRLAKKKSVLSALSVVAVTGTVIGFQMNKPADPVRYVLAAVTRGALVTSVTASGQVTAENQIDITPAVSGAIIGTYVKLGDEVTTDTPLFEIDRRSAAKAVRIAQQSVRDAQISLESAQISYEKLLKPKNTASVLQAQNALNQAERNLEKLQEGPDPIDLMNAEAKVHAAEQNAKLASDGKTPKTVRDAYDKNVITLNSLVAMMQNALDDSNDILGVDGAAANINFANLFSVLDQGKKIQAVSSYARAKEAISAAKNAVDPLALRDEDPAQIDAATTIVNDALETTETLLEDMKGGLDASLTSFAFSQTSLDSYTSTIQSDITNVTNGYGTITSMRDAIDEAIAAYDNSAASLAQAKAELDTLKAGATADELAAARETLAEREQALKDASAAAEDIDLKTALNTIEQRKSSLQNARDNVQDALETLNDYTVRAPFDGVIAKMDAKNAGQVSPSTVLATILTKAKIADVSLNEVDVSKIKVGQKATLTFDAVADLTIAGTVSEVDMVGTATQGVVTYKVKIAFLTEDERIKSGMSVSASIVTDVHTDVLLVPNGAIRRLGDTSAVETLPGVALNAESTGAGVPSASLPEAKSVTTGLSNEQSTEIMEGLKEGDVIVVRTIQPATTASAGGTATTQNSAIRIPGVGGLGGGGNATFRAAR